MLLEETERLVTELEGYVRRINRTNLSATLAGGETTLTDALARERRELDTAIQQTNWAIDLTEG